MNTNEIAKKYLSMCRDGQHVECVDALFAPDAVSVEAASPPGGERTARGLAAIHEKGKRWSDNHTVHKAEMFGPYPHDDRFAVRFVYDVTNKPTGKRFTLDEVGVFTVANGKITREEFFYAVG